MQFNLDGKGEIFFLSLLFPKQGFEVSFMLWRLGNVHGRCVVLKQFLGSSVTVQKVKIFMLSHVKFYLGPTKAGRKKLKRSH